MSVGRDPALAARLRDEAFELVRRRFAWETIHRDLAAWLDRIEPSP